MNDKKTIYSLLTALPGFLLSSCSQEEMISHAEAIDESVIVFHTSLPGVTTRSNDEIEKGDLDDGFHVAAISPERDGNGSLTIVFEEKLVTRTEGMGDAFRSEECKWPANRDGKEGKLKFFAYYPSTEVMKANSDADFKNKNYFYFTDASSKSGNNVSYNYRLSNYKINNDISLHKDFVAATAEGSKTDNVYSGITLEFEHKLCRIELKAWNNSLSHDIEIAGVRIGGSAVSSTYNLAGNWLYGSATEWGSVEYIFRAGEEVLQVNKDTYPKNTDAVSIMGKGGPAMMIPHYPSNLSSARVKWNNTSDPTNKNNGMYFSVLLRVKDRIDGMQLYPYIEGAQLSGSETWKNQNVVYLSVEKDTDKVLERVKKMGTATKP